MTDAVTVALITAVVSLIVALTSGGVGVWNRRRTDQNVDDIQSLKGAIDRDLERLRAKLAHGQTVSATQWSAEFAAYQAIWKGMVDVRPIADKLVNRESELHQIGMPEEYFSSPQRLEQRKKLTQQLVEASTGLLSAIHDNAPFYPALIRESANEAQRTAVRLVHKSLSAFTEATLSNNVAQTQDYRLECAAILVQLFREIDKVESLIRERLAAVQVMNPMVVEVWP